MRKALLKCLLPLFLLSVGFAGNLQINQYTYYDFNEDEIKFAATTPILQFPRFSQLEAGLNDNGFILTFSISLLRFSDYFHLAYLPEAIDINIGLMVGYDFQEEDAIGGIGVSLIKIEF